MLSACKKEVLCGMAYLLKADLCGMAYLQKEVLCGMALSADLAKDIEMRGRDGEWLQSEMKLI